MSNCVFCNVGLDPNQEIILQNDRCMFLQLKRMEIEGSGLIVPKEHRETVFDLSKEEWESTFFLLKDVKAYIDKRYKPDGYNIGWNCGEVGGQHIFHAHLHVIPRFKDEPFAGKGIRHWFKSLENQRTK